MKKKKKLTKEQKEMFKRVEAITVLVVLRSILRGELQLTEFNDKDSTYEFEYKAKFVGNDIIWLQNLSEVRIDSILEDIEKLYKKYCPKDWDIFFKEEIK